MTAGLRIIISQHCLYFSCKSISCSCTLLSDLNSEPTLDWHVGCCYVNRVSRLVPTLWNCNAENMMLLCSFWIHPEKNDFIFHDEIGAKRRFVEYAIMARIYTQTYRIVVSGEHGKRDQPHFFCFCFSSNLECHGRGSWKKKKLGAEHEKKTTSSNTPDCEVVQYAAYGSHDHILQSSCDTFCRGAPVASPTVMVLSARELQCVRWFYQLQGDSESEINTCSGFPHFAATCTV